jgi:hypothetical protein
MPPKKTVAAAPASGAGKNLPAAKRQRTLTNKQQQLGKVSSKFEGATNLWSISHPEK